jgi:hypothetical protein
VEFEKGTLDADLSAIVFDVSEPSAPKEVGRIRSPDPDGRVHWLEGPRERRAKDLKDQSPLRVLP